MLLVQIIPFQLLIIPIYVLIVRNYGLADSYLGMIAPFAINSTAVFIFRQFFLQLPDDLFAAAALDGASELRILWSIALPLVRPAILTACLITFIGPVERVPVAVPRHQGPGPATPGGDAGQLHQQHRRSSQQPVRRHPRGRGGVRSTCRCAVRGVPEALHGNRDQQRSQGMNLTMHLHRSTRRAAAFTALLLAGGVLALPPPRRRVRRGRPRPRGGSRTSPTSTSSVTRSRPRPRPGTRRTGSRSSRRSACSGPTPTGSPTAASPRRWRPLRRDRRHLRPGRLQRGRHRPRRGRLPA